MESIHVVVPAKAGTQDQATGRCPWTPAFAGVTRELFYLIGFRASVLVLKFTTSGKPSSLRGARRATKQSRASFAPGTLDCFAALAMTVISG